MSSEESPLLNPSTSAFPLDSDKIYDRFSPSQKRTIVSVVSWAALIPRTFVLYSCSLRGFLTYNAVLDEVFVSESFVPSIPQVARELGSTGPIIKSVIAHLLLFFTID